MHNVGECRTCVDHKRHPSGGDTLPYFAVDFGWKVLTEQPAVMRELRDIWRIAARGENVTLLCGARARALPHADHQTTLARACD